MQIGELARRTSVPTKTIRYYEDIGVMPPPVRADNGYREYEPDMVDRLTFIKDAQATGLTLAEIAYVLDLRGQGIGTCHHVLDLLERHLVDVDRDIATLRKTRKQLEALAERARAMDPAACTDPNRCQTITNASELIGDGGAASHHAHHRPRRHAHR